MKSIIIHKVVSSTMKVYIGLQINAGSDELLIVKKCRFKYWNTESKLWLIPNSSENWAEVKRLFDGYAFVKSNNEIVLKTLNDPAKYSNEKKEKPSMAVAKEKQLNLNQYEALINLKKHLTIKQYSISTQN